MKTLDEHALWRISRHDDLEGLGGEKADGRWHTAAKGKRIVYLSEHPALALIEVLANLRGNPRLFPDTYRLMKVLPDRKVVEAALRAPALEDNWIADLSATRRIGDAWLAESRSALLLVPSAPSPESFNYLLNPLHADSRRFDIDWTRWVQYDKRLFHISEDRP